MSLPDRPRAVVTGAGGGLGRALCLELARRRGRVIAADIDLDAAEITAAAVRDAGGEAKAVACDVAQEAQVAALADAVTGRSASTLYAWAAISALACGELADIPACHATQAVLADPDDELAWDAFVDAVRSYCPPDLFDDVRGWADDPERATTLVDRALASFATAADDWSEDEREALAGLRAALGR